MVWFMVFSITLNNISVISWRSVLLMEETGVPGENHRPVASHWQTLSHNVVSSTPRHEWGSNVTTLVVIGTDCTSNYHTITTTTAHMTKRKRTNKSNNVLQNNTQKTKDQATWTPQKGKDVFKRSFFFIVGCRCFNWVFQVGTMTSGSTALKGHLMDNDKVIL
jgi:hypothetical protein